MSIPYDSDFCGRSSAANLIKTIQAEGGVSLDKMLRGQAGGQLRQPVRPEKLTVSRLRALKKDGITLRSMDLYKIVDDTFNSMGVRGDGIDVIAKIHANGPRRRSLGLPPDEFSGALRKGLPPQSANAAWDDAHADTGAPIAHDGVEADRQRAGVRQQVTPFGGPHSAPHASSVRSMQALRTQADGEKDPTVEAVKIALRTPRQLVPGSLRGDRAQDPNRDDAVR